jgi:hypothetical protein
MPRQELAARSTLIIRGEVLDTTLLRAKLQRPRWRGAYRSRVRIVKVEKGSLAPGKVITIAWDSTRWVGPGRKPPGHWDYPSFNPCEAFHAHLTGGKGSYAAVHYNGKRCLSRCSKVPLPEKVGQTVRCGARKAR